MDQSPEELAQELRERRRVAGLTRSKLAAQTGLSASLISRFERGEVLPDEGQARAIGRALDPESAAPAGEADSAAEAPPVAVMPEPREEGESEGVVDPPVPPRSLLERVAHRLVQRRDVPGASVTPLPDIAAAPSRPAPSANDGLVQAPQPVRVRPAVFPDVPVASFDPEVHVYSTAPTTYPTAADDQTYLLRRIRTAVILIGLATVLWWAVGAFQEGFGDVIDLFRAPTTTLG